MVYFGTPSGHLIELDCPSEQTVGSSERYVFQTTLEGGVRAQVVPLQRREWQVRLPRTSKPEDVAKAQEILSGAWGDGPFWFISADAPSTNLLTPGQSTCDPEAGTGLQLGNFFAGPMRTPDGWAPRSIGNENTGYLLYFGAEAIPVLPGVPVTASAYVTGNNARVRVYFYDDSLEQISFETSPITAEDGVTVRSVVTSTPPEGAMYCRIFGVSTVQGCRPAVTWGDHLYPWADGQGCPKAVVHGGGREVIRAVSGPNGQRLQALSFTVTEVG